MNILLPTDFSDHSLNACAYALDLFAAAGNTYILMHTYVDTLPGHEAMVDMTSARYADGVEDMAAFLTRFRGLPAAREAVVVTDVVKGLLTAAVAEVSKAKVVDVVVMGTQGATGLALFGSNAGSVAASGPVPVLVVPGEAHYKGLQRILLADDHAPMGKGSLALLLRLAHRTKAHVAVAHVLGSQGGAADPLIIADRDALLSDIPHSYVEASGDDVALVLSNLAERTQVDLVVVLHRHVGALAGLFHSSTAKRLAMHGHIPLLVLEQ